MSKLNEDTNVKNGSLISVVIPVYNVAPYLDRCLRSVTENDYRELQIICVNDGSTDDSGSVLESWAQKDTRIQVIATENQGLSEARNTGIREATGEYIAFIDSDDWIHSRYFSTLLNGIMLHSADISVCGNIRVKNDDFQENPVSSDIIWSKIDISQFSILRKRVEAWGKLYKRNLAQPVFDHTMLRCEDVAYNMNLIFEHPEMIISVTDEPLYYYFNRPGSLWNTANEKTWKRMLDYFIQLSYRCAEKNDEILQSFFVNETIKRALSYRYMTMFDPNCKIGAKDICNKALKMLYSTNGVSMKRRIVYTLFLLFPVTYRTFRIINDPTMKNWEKNQRKAAKASPIEDN